MTDPGGMAYVGHLTPEQEAERAAALARFEAATAAIAKKESSNLEYLREFLTWAKNVRLPTKRFGLVRRGWPAGMTYSLASHNPPSLDKIYLAPSGVLRFESGERYGSLKSGNTPAFVTDAVTGYLTEIGMLDAWQRYRTS
jgi:hypothetical protein